MSGGLGRGPELAELRVFCAAIDLGSLGRAARVLHVSQPAVSKRLQALETLAGVQLLERSHEGVSPTLAGTQLYWAARRVLAEGEAVEQLIGGIAIDGVPTRLAVSPTLAESILPGQLADFESRNERHLAVELAIVSSTMVRELVRVGRADLGLAAADLTAEEDGHLRQIPLCEDEIVVAVPLEHPWAARDEIDLDEFVGTQMIMRDPGADSRRTVDAALRRLGLALAPPLAEIGNTAAAKEAALRECAPVLLSRLVVGATDEGLLVRQIANMRFPRRFMLLYGTEKGLSPVAHALMEHLSAGQALLTGPNGRAW